MQISEIIYPLFRPLFEMAFERKVIIDRLRGLQDPINEHAIKIIAWHDAQEVSHWKHELMVWGNRLAGMDLHTGRGKGSVRPMGFDLAWRHLYQEPFELSKRALPFRIQVIQREYQRPITKQPDQIMAELMVFLRSFCQSIGQGQLVDSAVDTLGQPTIPAMEAAAQ